MRVDIYFRLKTNIFLNLDTSLFYPEPTYNITIIYNNILAKQKLTYIQTFREKKYWINYSNINRFEKGEIF